MRSPLFAVALACGALACGPWPPPADVPLDAAPREDAARGDAGPLDLTGLPVGRWSMVAVPGAVCGNGSQAYIGVNPAAGARRLFVVVQGGGACWDADGCLDSDRAATHVHEDYTAAHFTEETRVFGILRWDNRAEATNPFRQDHLVYVPYCTGDLHAGDRDEVYDPSRPSRVTHHRGGRNMRSILEAMRSSWPSLDRVRVLGLSAGGYGVQFHRGRFGEAWPSADVALLADCAPFIDLDPAFLAMLRARWALETPSDCPACTTSLSAYTDYYDSHAPRTRLGLLATAQDAILIGYFDIDDYNTRLEAFLTGHLARHATTRSYVINTADHVIFGQAFTRRTSGVLLLDWLAGWLDGDARFANVHY